MAAFAAPVHEPGFLQVGNQLANLRRYRSIRLVSLRQGKLSTNITRPPDLAAIKTLPFAIRLHDLLPEGVFRRLYACLEILSVCPRHFSSPRENGLDSPVEPQISMNRVRISLQSSAIGRGLLALFFSLALAGEARAQTNVPTAVTNRFEKNVRDYELADRRHRPPKHAILLVGDSQFFRWKTVHEDLRGYSVVNRGIDSFQTSDLVYFADRLVVPYRPRMIVTHIGGNDVHTGKNPEQVLKDFKAFVAKVRAHFPAVPIAFTSLTPSPGRWAEAPQRKAANQLVKDYVATQPNLLFIDLWDAMLTPDGQPREDLWVADRVHPNHEGYLLRVKIMRPLLGKPDRK